MPSTLEKVVDKVERVARAPRLYAGHLPFVQNLFSAQQVPRFPVDSMLGKRVVGRQINGRARFCDGNDVPAVGWNHIDREKIYVRGGVGVFPAAIDRADIVIASAAAGGFYLHAQEATASLDHEVVAAAVSPRSDHAQVVLGGAGHEKQFCPFAAQLEAAVGRFAVSEH